MRSANMKRESILNRGTCWIVNIYGAFFLPSISRYKHVIAHFFLASKLHSSSGHNDV